MKSVKKIIFASTWALVLGAGAVHADTSKDRAGNEQRPSDQTQRHVNIMRVRERQQEIQRRIDGIRIAMQMDAIDAHRREQEALARARGVPQSTQTGHPDTIKYEHQMARRYRHRIIQRPSLARRLFSDENTTSCQAEAIKEPKRPRDEDDSDPSGPGSSRKAPRLNTFAVQRSIDV